MGRIILLVCLFTITLFGQENNIDSTLVDIESDIIFAFKNAMKGVVWAIDNVPFKKEQTYKDIIDNNLKVCSIKIYKQEGGIKIISIGYFNSSQVEITTYKSLPEKFR